MLGKGAQNMYQCIQYCTGKVNESDMGGGQTVAELIKMENQVRIKMGRCCTCVTLFALSDGSRKSATVGPQIPKSEMEARDVGAPRDARHPKRI